MKEWHFNVLFFVGVGGAITLLFGPSFGLKFDQDPTAVAGVGAILSYVLTQKEKWTKKEKKKDPPHHGFEEDRAFYQEHRQELAERYNLELIDELQKRLIEGEEDKT